MFRQGFTLLELLIVLVLVGLMSGLTLPRFSGSLTSIQAKSAVNKVAAMLRHARNQAVSSQTAQLVLFDFSGSRVISCPPEAFPQAGIKSVDAWLADAGKDVRSYQLPENVRIQPDEAQEKNDTSAMMKMVFFPSGNCTGGKIIFTGKQGRFYRVSVDFITAIVEIQ
ncbi:MAG: GspH/FimT family pseudopilin [Deltaproteobacteria bacterium]|nr:GspH/FimT family pseudopilin [Deltaproteobacteria bacterium]